MWKIRRGVQLLLMGAMVTALAGCGHHGPKPAPIAATGVEQEIRSFHQRLDAGEFAAIWKGADDAFRRGVPRAQFDQYFTTIHQQLGHVVASEQMQSTSTGTPARPTLLALQNTHFEHGAGIETFTFLMAPQGATLIGYNLQSEQLPRR